MTGWWYTYPSEKYESQLGRMIPYIMESHKSHVPKHQPDEESPSATPKAPKLPPAW